MNLIQNASDFVDRLTPYAEMASEIAIDGFLFGQKTWLSKKVENWTYSSFRPTTAKVVRTCIGSLPYFLATLFLPLPVYSIGACILLVFRAARAGNSGNELYAKDIFTLPTIHSIINAAVTIFGDVLMPFRIGAGVAIAIDLFVLHRVGFTGEIVDMVSDYYFQQKKRSDTSS